MEQQKEKTFETELEEAIPYLLPKAYLYYCDNSQDAHDLVQETLARAWRYKDNYEVGTRILAWLSFVMRGIYLNQSNRAKNLDRIITESRAETYYIHPQGDLEREDPLDKVLRKDLTSLLLEDMKEELLPEQLEALILHVIYEKSTKEIASLTGVPRGTILSRIFHARKKSRAFLFDRYGIEQYEDVVTNDFS